MVDEKELAEALARYRVPNAKAYWKSDHVNGEYWDEELAERDTHTIASAYCELFFECDEAKVTPEWLVSIGAERFRDGQFDAIRLAVQRSEYCETWLVVHFGNERLYLKQFLTGYPKLGNGVGLTVWPKNRLAFRQLCAALGIELKEPAATA